MSDYGFGHDGLNNRAMRQERVWQWRQTAHGLSAAVLRERVRIANDRLSKGYGHIGEQTEMVEAFEAELTARANAAAVAQVSRKARPETADKPATVADLCRVTGLGRDAVYAAIRAGELPGYVINGNRFVIPREAFDRFCRGEWVETPKPVLRGLRFVGRDVEGVA